MFAQKTHSLTHWLQKRSPQYIALRLQALFQRYGISSARAKQRTLDCVNLLASHACSPTFPTPGRVVGHHAAFCRQLQELGTEFAVHGYDHVDFYGLTRQQATEQFVRATETYQQSGIQSPGFRCPYLSYSESARQAARDTQFTYSSNQAIWWDVVSPQAVQGATPVFEQLRQFYRADAAADVVSTPMLADGLVEIPTSLPDDLQLYDGLKLGEQGLAQAWLELHQQVYRRGEMAVILFHPESFYQCAPAFDQLLRAARDYQPAVWVARLRDIADWWWEKSRFQVASTTDTDHLRLTFECSDRATIVIRDLETDMPTQPWYGAYRIVEGRTGRFSADVRPFIGVASDVPPHTISFLQEQGHIVETGAEARRCGTYLDGALIERLTTQVQLIEHIEAAATPLVRFWRWPQGYRSVLSITGDLDALSLLDYVGRLLPRK